MRDFNVDYRPTEEQRLSGFRVRAMARELALTLVDEMPPGRELSNALSRLEEVVGHAAAGVLRPPAA